MLGIVVGPTLAIPNVASLAGATFWDQALLLDPTANALGVVVSQVTSTLLGSNRGGPGAIVYARGSSRARRHLGVSSPSS